MSNARTTAVPSHLLCLFQECNYPELYSIEYQRCIDFQSVKCGERIEVQSPCRFWSCIYIKILPNTSTPNLLTVTIIVFYNHMETFLRSL